MYRTCMYMCTVYNPPPCELIRTCLWPKVSTRIFNATPALTTFQFLASGQLFLTITKSKQESLCKHGDVHHHKQYVLCANNTMRPCKIYVYYFCNIRALCACSLTRRSEQARIVLYIELFTLFRSRYLRRTCLTHVLRYNSGQALTILLCYFRVCYSAFVF